MLSCLFLIAVVQHTAQPATTAEPNEILKHFRVIQDLRRAGKKAEHQVEKLELLASRDAKHDQPLIILHPKPPARQREHHRDEQARNAEALGPGVFGGDI